MINYVIGDATEPVESTTLRFVAHINNDVGAWGAGFVLAVSEKWPFVKNDYIKWADGELFREFKLGEVQLVYVGKNTYVFNMVAQGGPQWPPCNYEALEKCLKKVNDDVSKVNGSVHMPRIGVGIGGGDWGTVEAIIHKVMTVPVYVYDLPKTYSGKSRVSTTSTLKKKDVANG